MAWEMPAIPPSKSLLARPELRCAVGFYLAFVASVALGALSFNRAWVPVATLLLLSVFSVGAIDALRTAEEMFKAWRSRQLGANVRRALATLGPSYRVVTRHSPTPTRESHIAIGPNGVFLVLSSDDGGRVTASEQRLFVNARVPWRNLVEDCRVETLRISDRLQRALGRTVPVHAVLCFTRALVAVGQEIRGVKIVQVPRLARMIASTAAPSGLNDGEIEAARTALVKPSNAGPPRPVFRFTRRRMHGGAERPLTLVGRSPSQHQGGS